MFPGRHERKRRPLFSSTHHPDQHVLRTAVGDAPGNVQHLDAEDAAEVEALLAQLNVDADEEPPVDAEAGSNTGQRVSVYGDITQQLVARGIPRDTIAWIHDARTASDREALFARMRTGDIRILIGSTFRMGVGVNVQERCYAVHHLTTPWRPCDVKQADGRIWRPGNLFPEVWIFRYIASPSFDGFSWQGIETKGKFEDAYLRGDPKVRKMGDVDEQIISAGEIKAIASGDPRIVQKVRLEHELEKLEQMRRGFEGTRRSARMASLKVEESASDQQRLVQRLREALAQRTPEPSLTLLGTAYDLSTPELARAAGKAIRDNLMMAWAAGVNQFDLKRRGMVLGDVGTYRGLVLRAVLELDRQGKAKLPWMFLAPGEGADRLTNAAIMIGERAAIIDRMELAANDLEGAIERREAQTATYRAESARIRTTLDTPWEHERTYRMMGLGLRYLNAALDENQSKTEQVITEVLALAESEGLDIEEILKDGQSIAEEGPDLSKIRVQLPPHGAHPAPQVALALTDAEEAPPQTVLALTDADDAPSQAAPQPAPQPESGQYISLSIFADPLPIARPTLEVASLDLKDFATEAARKKAELANKKRQKELEKGQTCFFDF